MDIYLNQFRRYSFLLTDAIKNGANFSITCNNTNRDDDLYCVVGFGKDNTGFYYSDQYYAYQSDGTKVAITNIIQHYWYDTSGTFEIEFSSSSSVDETIYGNGFTVLPMFTINSVDGLDITYTTNGFEENYADATLPIKINIHLAPHTHYVFASANIDVFGHTYESVYDYLFDYEDVLSPTRYTTTLNLDGTVDIEIILKTNAYDSYSWGLINLSLSDLTGVLLRDEYNVTLSSTGITFSNTSTTASTLSPYTNTLSLASNYSWEESIVIVTMNGNDVSYYYNSTTHVITIPQVLGNITVTAVAKPLRTFNFYSADGLTLRGTATAIKISSLKFELVGSVRKIYVNNTLITTYTVAIPDGYTLIGLSDTANSDTYIVPVNIEYTEIFESDKNFYECLVAQSIIPSGFTLNLYQSKAESNHVDKTGYIHSVGQLTGTLRTSSNVVDPVVRIEYSQFPNFNYVYIPQFHRYYFVNEIVSVNHNIWDIVLHVDVLMSFKDVIRSQYGFIERNQYTFNKNEIDNLRTYENVPEYEYVEIQNNIFDVSSSGTTISGVDKDLRFVVTIVGD